MSRLAGFNPGNPKVGFKLEEPSNDKPKGHNLDTMLDAINLGETDGIERYATLHDLDGKSGVFNTRDAMNQNEEELMNHEDEVERKRLEEENFMA